MHRVHPCSAVILSSLLLFISIISSDDYVMFRSDNDGFICWRSSTPIVYDGILPWYGYDTLGMHGVEVGLCFLFFFVFLMSLCHKLCWNQHITTLLFSISSFITFFPMLHCIPISSTSFSFSATQDIMVTTFILINLWSLGSSPSGQYQCFIHINFIFFSFLVDILLLHPHLLLYPPWSYEPVIFGIFTSQTLPVFHLY